MTAILLLAAVLYREGPVTITGEGKIDPAKALFITVEPKGIELRERFRGFSVAEDYEDGKCTHWRLIPEPCAEAYKIAPFAWEGKVHGPVYFAMPEKRESVTGEMEADPRRDLPPLTWKLAGMIALALAAAAGLAAILWKAGKLAFRKVREHYMSPIERARAELGRLLDAKLPQQGRYKDFYVELTMVVRRYIQRKYGVKAPHLTTEEFLREAKDVCAKAGEELKEFLESADMVKFAGVAATIEMTDEATRRAKEYLEGDNDVR